MLDLTRVENGKINLDCQDTDTKEVIGYAYNTVLFLAEQKNVKLEIYYEGEIPLLKIDKEKTTWVLVNLLSYAIRYSTQSSKVNINVKRVDNKVLISIEDFGKGIDPIYKERIFEKYFKIPEGDNNLQGTGLGLAISKEFIEAQGGEIRVHSQVGKTTMFELIFTC